MNTRTALIFGCEGQLGTSLAHVYKDVRVIGIPHREVDIGNRAAVTEAITEAAPDVVINTAGYNAVERAGMELTQAYAANAFGPFYIAEASAAVGIPFVQISTDYVFDGTKGSYTESDIPFPLNAYGASKHAGEELVHIAHAGSYIVRTSALFGNASREGKRNFASLMLEKVRAGEELRVVSDQRTVPTFTDDLALAIRTLIESEAPPGVYHLTNEGSASWAEFAEEILRQKGIDGVVHTITTEDSNTAIARPRSTVLRSEKCAQLGIVLPPWQDGLRRYLMTYEG